MKETDIAGILTSLTPLRWWGQATNPIVPAIADEISTRPGVSRHSGFAKSCRKTLLGQQGYGTLADVPEKVVWSMFSVIQKLRGAWRRKLSHWRENPLDATGGD